jgi:hypothetical protein
MGSVEAHLKQAAKHPLMAAVAEEILEKEEELPWPVEYLWAYFTELNLSRGSGGFGPGPILYSEILAWMSCTGVWLNPWEIRAIKEVDAKFMEVTYARLSRAKPSNQQQPGDPS